MWMAHVFAGVMGQMPWLRPSVTDQSVLAPAVELVFVVPSPHQAPLLFDAIEDEAPVSTVTVPRFGGIVVVNEALNCSMSRPGVNFWFSSCSSYSLLFSP